MSGKFVVFDDTRYKVLPVISLLRLALWEKKNIKF